MEEGPPLAVGAGETASERSTQSKVGAYLEEYAEHLAPSPRSQDRASRTESQPLPFIVALVPAHDEEHRLAASLESLRGQSRPPDEIIVIADNCTDNTAGVAAALGASVVVTHGNNDRKAGALNQTLEKLLPLLDETDAILVMDADTSLSADFIRAALRVLFTPAKGHKPVGGVGGIFLSAKEKWSVAVQLQINEYTRYQRRLGRRRGRALVLTGTGTLFNIRSLRAVVAGRRSGQLPDQGGGGFVYDTDSLTEDNELTLCIKELGFRVLSPKECVVETAIMPTLPSLYRQRRRWQRGALENILAHRLNRHTIPYFLRQILTYSGVVFTLLYLVALTVALTRHQQLPWAARLWFAVAVLYVVEQAWSVRAAGRRAVLFSLAVLPELFYNFFLNFIYVVCLEGLLFATREKWGRLRDIESADRRSHDNQDQASSHAKGASRTSYRARLFQVTIEVAKDFIGLAFLLIPIVNLAVAWRLISAYVLMGSLATVGRLIPVRRS